ncbi:hypothetical protein BDA99DRAFT_560940 [Phascolomyces articulosus]|uniref:Uncharacterized protein n=1 Tax=Phascolomyces articulosus TaxID=60185 RepID=A0AAD5PEH2_9FUNG|nr:hypothetical protein BDA99DRAFT_560940 [Phascolomyces articulosus]
MILRIPFTRSAYTGNTIPPWEQNEWYRSHGYEFPLDTYLLLQWIAGVIVDVGFFGFMYYFINDQPISDTTHTLVKAWNSEQETTQVVQWPWAAWSWKISFFLKKNETY